MAWLIFFVAVLQLGNALAWLPAPAQESRFSALLDLNAIAHARSEQITRGCEQALQHLVTDITADNLTEAETVMLQASGTGLNQAGQYKLCQRTPTVHHCLLRLQPYNYSLSATPLAAVGLCLPDQCNPSDVQALVREFMVQRNITGLVPLATCGDNKKAWTSGAITVVVLLSVMGYLVLLATLFDVYRYYKNGRHRRSREHKKAAEEHHLYQPPVHAVAHPPDHLPSTSPHISRAPITSSGVHFEFQSQVPAVHDTDLGSSRSTLANLDPNAGLSLSRSHSSASSDRDLPHLRPVETFPHDLASEGAVGLASLSLFEDLSAQPLESKRAEDIGQGQGQGQAVAVETTRETKTETTLKTVRFSPTPEEQAREIEAQREQDLERERHREPLVSLIEGKTALSSMRPDDINVEAGWPSLAFDRPSIFGAGGDIGAGIGARPASHWHPHSHPSSSSDVRAEMIPRSESERRLYDKAFQDVSIKTDERSHTHFWSHLISSFSLLRGWKKLMSPRSAHYVAPLDGLRVLSMGWVILGHTYAFSMSWPGYDDGIASIAQDARTFTFQAVMSGFYAVDTFLFLSGFLVTLAMLRRWNRKHRKHVDSLLADVDRDLERAPALGLGWRPDRGSVPPSTFAAASTRLACPEAEAEVEAIHQPRRPSASLSPSGGYRYRYRSLSADLATHFEAEAQAEAQAELETQTQTEAEAEVADAGLERSQSQMWSRDHDSMLLVHMYGSKSTATVPLGTLFADLPFFYINRYLRLTPLLLFAVLIFWHLYPKFGSGPFWLGNLPNGENCHRYWWSTLLYINNFVPKHVEDMCLPWSWYLAVDTQLFILAPFLIMGLFYSANLGLTLWLVASTISLACLIALSVHYNLTSAITSPEWLTFFDKVYSKFYTRAHPYLMGMLTAYLFLRLGRAYRFSKTAIAMMLTIAAITLAAPVFGTYTQYKDDALTPSWSRTENVMYISFSRWSWGLGLALLTLLACTHQAGVVGSFLGAKIWHPLGRLTYATYLLHPILMIAFFESRTVFVEYSKTSMTLFCLAFMAASYFLALIAHLTIELPCSNLVDTLWHTLRSKPTTAITPTDFADEKNVHVKASRSISHPNNPSAGMALVA